ncbi:hypothetical protein PybrP1_009802 [[Pythium] brassicae (nom. inval.)]|nr:hypothetical protein PybrP1_009802 [[Pythium] brassicae (nom. inval.)]
MWTICACLCCGVKATSDSSLRWGLLLKWACTSSDSYEHVSEAQEDTSPQLGNQQHQHQQSRTRRKITRIASIVCSYSSTFQRGASWILLEPGFAVGVALHWDSASSMQHNCGKHVLHHHPVLAGGDLACPLQPLDFSNRESHHVRATMVWPTFAGDFDVEVAMTAYCIQVNSST